MITITTLPTAMRLLRGADTLALVMAPAAPPATPLETCENASEGEMAETGKQGRATEGGGEQTPASPTDRCSQLICPTS